MHEESNNRGPFVDFVYTLLPYTFLEKCRVIAYDMRYDVYYTFMSILFRRQIHFKSAKCK